MDDAGAILRAHIISRDDIGIIPLHRKELVERFIVQPDQILGCQFLQHLIARTQRGIESRGGQIKDVAADIAHLGVFDLGTDGQGHIARQGPGGRRPGEQILIRAIFYLELDVDTRINGAFLVAQRQLVAA